MDRPDVNEEEVEQEEEIQEHTLEVQDGVVGGSSDFSEEGA
jgi:hypothetical protein